MIAAESAETVSNPFKFTGQWFDSENDEYYLRNRQYDPMLMRLTGRDSAPIMGKFGNPLTSHRYLYCSNDSINKVDPLGLRYEPPEINNDVDATQTVIDAAVEFVRARGFPDGPIEAFSWRSYEFDYKFPDEKGNKYTFQISDSYIMTGGQFTNWLTAYTCTYLYGAAGIYGSRLGGHAHALRELGHFDESESRYFLAGGILMGDERRWMERGKSIGNWDFINAKYDLQYGLDRIAKTDLYSTTFDLELELYTTFWNSGSTRYLK
jgi:RHS repeat-associated protein